MRCEPFLVAVSPAEETCLRVPQKTWAAFMSELQALSHRHPYVIPPSAKQMGKWGACFAMGERVS